MEFPTRMVMEEVVSPNEISRQPGGSGIISEKFDHRHLEDDLQRLNRFEALNCFVHGVAHDFNNLLTAIWGNVAVAKRLIKPDTGVYPRLDGAEQAALQARELINRLLAFSGDRESRQDRIAVAALLREFELFFPIGGKTVGEFSLSGDPGAFIGDKLQIKQVLHQLLSNARQAMEQGGTVRVRARRVRLETPHPILAAGEHVKISVHDQGCGLSRREQRQIFDPYFTTQQKDCRRGTGFGLAICYVIIRKHQGLITVESRAGKGAVFHVYLPGG